MNFIQNFQLISDMEIEYTNIHFKFRNRPSPYSFLVAIPMFMYRIETNDFLRGLNFFQKNILRFFSFPGLTIEEIASVSGFDVRLVEKVRDELMSMGFINQFGSLSEYGKEKLLEVQNLIFNSKNRKIGYIFKYIDEDRLYKFYIDKIYPAELILDKYSKFPSIITGTNNEEIIQKPLFFKSNFGTMNFNNPTSREILRVFQNTIEKFNFSWNSDKLPEISFKKLAFNYVHTKPELIWLCTYIFLKPVEGNKYSSDWKVLDPFFDTESIELKLYLERQKDRILINKIKKEFNTVDTIENKLFSDFHSELEELVINKIKNDFGDKLNKLEKNLQDYIEALVKDIIYIEKTNLVDINRSLSFSSCLQNILENILKQDRKKRKFIYDYVFNHLDTDYKTRKTHLKDIYNNKLSSTLGLIPNKLENVIKSKLKSGYSLLSYLASFILTYEYDKSNVLFQILKDKIKIIVEIASLRNEKNHGQLYDETELKPLTKEQFVYYYNIIKSIINDLIEKNWS